MSDRRRAETEAETADRLRHGSSFGAAAPAYAEHRPGYAEAAVRWALEPVLVRPAPLGRAPRARPLLKERHSRAAQCRRASAAA